MLFTNISIKDGEIYFTEFTEVRQMKMEHAPSGRTEAKVTLKITGHVSIANALKAALDKSVIHFRKSLQSGFDPKKGDDEFAKWMSDYDSTTLELDMDNELSSTGRVTTPVDKVGKVIKKVNQNSLIENMIAKGISKEDAEKAIAAFLE